MYRCGVIDKCIKVPSRDAAKEEILLVHTEEHYNKMVATAAKGPVPHPFPLLWLVLKGGFLCCDRYHR